MTIRDYNTSMITLGIDTSCDESAFGVIRGGQVLANIVSSQIGHTRFGGVVPELAARSHMKVILPLLDTALAAAHLRLEDVDLFCATYGPGLIGALLVGLSFAKSLSIALKKDFVGVNHLEGHVFALQLGSEKPRYPYLVLLVSGGHTEIVLVKGPFIYETLGRTSDDACGEAFDKVAKLMNLPYPGGPYIEKYALEGKTGAIPLPVPKPKEYSFSYSGLKTAALYYTRDHPTYDPHDLAASFQRVAVEHLIQVVERALVTLEIRSMGIVGGVAVNSYLRKRFGELCDKLKVKLYIPEKCYCTDNGVMIAMAGAGRFKKFGPSPLALDAKAREPIDIVGMDSRQKITTD